MVSKAWSGYREKVPGSYCAWSWDCIVLLENKDSRKRRLLPVSWEFFPEESFRWLLTKWNKASVLLLSFGLHPKLTKLTINQRFPQTSQQNIWQTWVVEKLRGLICSAFSLAIQLGFFSIKGSFQSLRFILFHEKRLWYTFNMSWLSSKRRLDRTLLFKEHHWCKLLEG